jgi:cytidine deaminase
MLLMSAADDAELEGWRTKFGRCQLSPLKMRPQPTMQDVLSGLPSIMALILRVRFRAGGWAGPISLTKQEVEDIGSGNNLVPREIMVLLLGVASAMAQVTGNGDHIGAVVEGESGSLYVGAPYTWSTKEIKFSSHGVQTAVLNAWHQGEKKLTNLMVEAPPCGCCRQFLRELYNWNTLKILHASDGPKSLQKASITEIPFTSAGLRVAGVKERLMDSIPRKLAIGKSDANELINFAAEAASEAYAPYSGNSAGIALKTKRGVIYQGRYVESKTSIAGLLAVETAILNVIMSGETIDNIKEILLVETRGMVTQFSATQKLATAMGNVPFRFMMTT